MTTTYDDMTPEDHAEMQAWFRFINDEEMSPEEEAEAAAYFGSYIPPLPRMADVPEFDDEVPF